VCRTQRGIAIQPDPRRVSRAAASSLRKNLVLPQEKTRLGFAFGSPQDHRMQFMLRPGLARATELKRLARLRISPRPRASARPRGACVTLLSALIDAGICVRNHDFTTPCRVKSLRQRGFPYHSAPQNPQKPDALPPSRRKLPEVRRNKTQRRATAARHAP
jgi:hypothetical protein